MEFNQPLNVPTRYGYILSESYSYIWINGEHLYKITIPKGFEYDGASVPT